MELGMIGLGRMVGDMTQRLLWGGHSVVAYVDDSGEERWTLEESIDLAIV